MFVLVWFGLVVVGIIFQHYRLRWTRDNVLDSVPKNKIGRADLFIKSREKQYLQLFPNSWQFLAEVIFTETGIYVFRYRGSFGIARIFVKFHCLYAVEQDILPFLKTRLNANSFIHQIDLLRVEGRTVTIEFGEYASWAKRPFRQYRFVLQDVRGNHTYRNLLRFQRYRYDILQNQQHNSALPTTQNYNRWREKSAKELPSIEEKSNKEKIIDGLTSLYRYERAWTIKQLWAFDVIDEIILHLLKDISTTDPEPRVREAASELLTARKIKFPKA
ncbi:MAG: hypothetical protein DWQ04_17930 [Chloroflexi bacterium]|nr:MAG: hypothetical protein DWQ04_17930 [Chloroflexota bacterium]